MEVVERGLLYYRTWIANIWK